MSFPEYRKWSHQATLDCDGIVVGCNQSEEWLLSWWWDHYRRKNDYPVTFVDFGMSFEAKNWCKERGAFAALRLPDCFVAEKEEMDPALFPQWIPTCGVDFWDKRAAWFKKPAACLQSPYRRSIWLDLDCEVCGDLKELFAACENPSGIALANYSKTKTLGYNAGVIVFKRGNRLIQEWANQALDRNRDFGGDQDLLIAIIQEQHYAVAQIDLIFNWSRSFKENPHAIIRHWHGQVGKTIIANEISLQNLDETFH